uniref:Protein translocase subunit SecA n=1 Tax=Platysiphonia delicata TaxID=2006979 RepID=A0A1Z1M0Y3_9FLOR|nr:preprotein-translocase subunit a [Platysiphonia delicata]ARW59531.1 preprotein-translocase subunit a [Platysiphonia delicata]
MLNFFSQNLIKKYGNLILRTNKFYKQISLYNNKMLEGQTNKLTNQIKNEKLTINEILPEAFATIKEAIKRSTGLILFDVQILGAIILHEGKIAEMKTGEGKTMVAIVAAYLNCLNGKNIHIITVNDYLAKRDTEIARHIFKYLKINIGLIVSETNHKLRQKAYKCNITYITNSELGFDYLRDNMTVSKNELLQAGFDFAIIDEVDSILIDEARTPLIISGNDKHNSNKYYKACEVSEKLINTMDYDIDEKAKNVMLNDSGIRKCEKLLSVQNLYSIDNEWTRYIINSLKAKELFIKNKEYIVKNNDVTIVDEFTGRIMEGRRWSDGLHQAIEAKENLMIRPENKTLASVTYQNLFLLYKKLSGMTGTAKTEEAEFNKIYKMLVTTIPTNKICIRKDLPDLVYKSEYYKWKAVANECFDMYKIGRPTLIGTTSIEKSEFIANLLKTLKIPYNLLNARQENISREAEIIAQAGQRYSITISTNMAGRGTDIILGGNPNKIAKNTLVSYLKQKYKLKTYIQFENFSKCSNTKIHNLLDTININTIKQHTSFENIKLYIEDIDNKNDPDNKNNNNLQDVYTKILNEYYKICSKEKIRILKLGGLYVIGTERHESRRIDNQLRGRAGRQGDKGSSRFFVSLEDNLFRIFGGETIKSLMDTLKIDDNTPIESILLSKSLNSAQKKVESYFYDTRKQLFEYDVVINSQRQAIYTERKKILQSSFSRDCIIEYGENTIEEMLNIYKQSNIKQKALILQQILQLLNITTNISLDILNFMNLDEIKIFLYEQLRITYDLRENYLEQIRPGLIRKLEKYYLLQQIDQAWQKHLEKMSSLKEYIGWRSYGQQDPLIEYKNEAFNLFVNMIISIRQTVIYLIMRSRLIINN